MERGERIDSALYCRITFDDNISAEFPEHEEFIHQTAIPLLKSRYGIDTAVVQAERTYKDIFYSRYQRGRNIGIWGHYRLSTLYAHMNTISVTAGSEIRRGVVIGTVGSSGNSTGPHIHFEVRINGGTLDPAIFTVPRP